MTATSRPEDPVQPNSLAWLDDELAALEQAGLRRRLPPPLSAQGPVIQAEGQRLVNFASNDYLGLAADARLAEAAAAACRDSGVGRGASPLVCGRADLHAELERQLANLEHAEAALLFPSGFAANSGTIPALAGSGDAVFSDELNHASIVDGCRLSRADTHIYRHADAEHLDQLLGESKARRKLVVTDAVFSIDGDAAPLAELAEACRRHGAMLMVDEAHATGVFGPEGAGLASTLTDPGTVDIRIGTLSKALGSAGGFVAGSAKLIEWIANRARSYVYSTAHPAASAAAALAALRIMSDEPHRRTRVLEQAGRLRQMLQADGWDTAPSTTQIIPVVVGDPTETVRLAAGLREAGFWVGAIRPPSVPEGRSLLRIGVTAAHSDAMLEGLAEALRRLRA
ncbi:MAG: 8-amino-7-oxononanoate synthase [Planctomycetota bacterium]